MNLLSKVIQQRKVFTHTPRDHSIEYLDQINTDSGRFYRSPTGALYPSVTTVVGEDSKANIMAWRKRIGEEEANKISKKATSRGTRIHKLCEDYIDNAELDSNVSFNDSDNFIKLVPELHKIDNVVMQEERLYSDFLQMAGTVDCVAEYEGKLAIIDFKTSTKLKKQEYIKGYLCQATAYAIMFEERFGISVPRTVIIISVDNEDPQVFKQKRDDYTDELLAMRKRYKEKYGK
jgi:genome maintenance exonuclease 1